MKLVQLVPVIALTFTIASCAGYHVGSDKPHQLVAVKKLAVPTFKNDTLERRLETLVTNAVIKKLQMDGTYQITSVDKADAVFKGTITTITRRQFRADVNDNLITTEIQAGLVVKFSVQDKAGVELFAGQERDQSNLVLDPNFQITERQALADAAERLSFSLASDITNGW